MRGSGLQQVQDRRRRRPEPPLSVEKVARVGDAKGGHEFIRRLRCVCVKLVSQSPSHRLGNAFCT